MTHRPEVTVMGAQLAGLAAVCENSAQIIVQVLPFTVGARRHRHRAAAVLGFVQCGLGAVYLAKLDRRCLPRRPRHRTPAAAAGQGMSPGPQARRAARGPA